MSQKILNNKGYLYTGREIIGEPVARLFQNCVDIFTNPETREQLRIAVVALTAEGQKLLEEADKKHIASECETVL